MRTLTKTLSILIWLCCCLPLSAAAAGDAFGSSNNDDSFLPVEQAYRLSVTSSDEDIVLNWKISDGYYLYSHRTSVAISSSDGIDQPQQLTMGEGKPKHDEYFGDVIVYYHQLNASLAKPQTSEFALKVSSQGCADAGLCYPPRHQWFKVNLDSGTIRETDQASALKTDAYPASVKQPSGVNADNTESFTWARFLWMAAMAFAGGLILNLMPCVFPVLALKGISLVEASNVSANERRLHGLVYAAGVVTSFVLVAGVLLILRAGGEYLAWGYQLQSPWIVASLVYLFFVMGLSFSGFIELGASFAGVGQGLTEKPGMRGSFFTGVLAVIVASPCTAPFMGASIGFAFSQSTSVALLIFVALGLGMAAPFLLLSFIPHLSRHLPRPGQWMVTLKEVMAFPMYLTGIWLLWVLGRQTSVNAIMLVLCGCLLLVMAIYFWPRNKLQKAFSMASAIGALLLLTSNLMTPSTAVAKSDSGSISYQADTFVELSQQQEPLFLNVTADWCITCLANEKVALSSERVKQHFVDHDIRYVKADWTNQSDDITKLLARYGHSGVPLYVFFPGNNQQPVILPQLLTEDGLLSHLTDDKNAASL